MKSYSKFLFNNNFPKIIFKLTFLNRLFSGLPTIILQNHLQKLVSKFKILIVRYFPPFFPSKLQYYHPKLSYRIIFQKLFSNSSILYSKILLSQTISLNELPRLILPLHFYSNFSIPKFP